MFDNTPVQVGRLILLKISMSALEKIAFINEPVF